MTRLSSVILIALAAASCTADPQGLEWGFRFQNGGDETRAAFIEARILQGDCASGVEVYSEELAVPMTGTAALPAELGSGTHCFLGRARDASCEWYAAGQQLVELPQDMEEPIIVLLLGVTEEAACAPTECTAGQCGGMTDAGRIDAGPDFDAGHDAGFDAGPDFDAGPGDDAGRDAGIDAAIDAGPGTDAGCSDPLRDCTASGSCSTNISSDDDHCGSCGNRCGEASCSSSSCGCTSPLVYDGSRRCIDLMRDPEHCGGLSTRCAHVEYCVGGSCVCRPGLTDDGSGGCVDLATDPMNCGSLGTDCSTMGSMTRCRGGCEDSCNTGQTDCSGACVDVMNDIFHCGACGDACARDEVCFAGDCATYRPAIGCSTCPCTSYCNGDFDECRIYGSDPICIDD